MLRSSFPSLSFGPLAGRSLGRLSLAGVLALAACAEAPFSVHRQDNDLKTLKPTLEKLRQADSKAAAAPQNGSGHALAFVFAGPEKRAGKAEKEASGVERTLIGFDLTAGKELFAVPADARSRFVVSQGVLALREGDELVLRDAQSGAVRTRVPFEPGEQLTGLTADSSQIYIVTRKQGTGSSKSFVTALSPSGQQKWRLPAQGSVGAPAAGAGMVALPYRYQDVVVLDARTGSELTRIRQKDEQIGFVRAEKGQPGFFYGVGNDGVGWLDERSVTGEKNAIGYLSPKLGERVRVFLHWDGYRAEQTDFSAFDRNRLLWDAEVTADKVRFRGDQAVLHSYRFLFALDTNSGAMRWAYAQPRQNLMASDMNERAVLFAAQDGELGALDRGTGAKVMSRKLGLKPGQVVLGGVFDAAGFAPSGGETVAARPVLEVLRDIIFDRDSSFFSVKTFAVQALGKVEGPQAQSELVRIVTADGMPAQISRTAGDVLIARKDGSAELATLLTNALKQSYDYLEDKRPKGLDVLARVAASREIKEAAPLLAERLLDPATPAPALKEIALALGQLGGKDASRALRELLFVYRSDPLFAQDADALKRAGEGLLKIDGEAGRRTLQFVALEQHSLPAVSGHFRKLLDETAWRPTPATPPRKTPALRN